MGFLFDFVSLSGIFPLNTVEAQNGWLPVARPS